MVSKKFSTGAATALILAGGLVLTSPTLNWAQGTPGFTIFSGVKREDELSFSLDFEGRRGNFDRYRLEIPARKMNLAVNQFAITYPKNYKGEFDPKDIEIRIRQGRKFKPWPVQEVNWDKENRVLQIYPVEPVPAGNKVMLVLSNVKNPSDGGTYYFNGQILSPGDVPLLRYIGTWIVSIN